MDARFARLIEFAQYGVPTNYAASDLMRSDIEYVLLLAAKQLAQQKQNNQKTDGVN